MNRKFVSGLMVAAITLAPAAAWAGHGRAGLWTVSTTMEMANMPPMPPEAMAMMKSRGMKMPGMGKPFVSQVCMTQEEVSADHVPQMKNNQENCTSKVLSQTSSSVTAETTCHGRMDGVGHMQMSWRGNEHYEGTYSFKGSMSGRPQEMTSHYTGDFVKADCGSVKPYTAKMAH
ncbi:MAG TPA: DUF3617 domain-containing protein [Rhizomicrobium sp.]|nr:DUF3617 domain-containing protein [Rhizomicrobium sp.]